MATRRQVFWRVTYVVLVLVLAGLTIVAWRWHWWFGAIFLWCLFGALTPLGAVWSTWRERREAAPLGLPRPE